MLSIIIPAYNEEKYIGETIALIKSELTLPHEIIVSDDQSSDETVTIARKAGADKVVSHSVKHRTIAANRNFGETHAHRDTPQNPHGHAHEDILVFIDGDSRIKDADAFFKRALEHFHTNPQLVALTGALRVLPEIETRADACIYTIFNWVHYIKNNVARTGEASGKFQMIRRDAFIKMGGFREDLVTREDADMFQRLSKIGRVSCDLSLVIFHTGRRAHRIGWPRLLWIWMSESARVALFDKTKVKEWTAIR